MAKALGKDPTQNLFAVLLQQEAYDVDPKKLSKNVKKNAPTAVDKSAVVESAPASAPSHPPTPAEQAQARKQKEEEKKAIAAAQAAAQAEKQKAKAEAEAQGGKNQVKMSREQWELQNKQQKKQGNANENQQDNKQNQGQQNNNDGFQQVRSQNQGQRRDYQQGHGFQQGQDGGRRGGKEGGERSGRQGRGDGGRDGGRGGGRGGRGGGRRGGRSGDQPPRFDQNKNREFNQRGQNLTGEQRQRGREHDRKSGKFVKNFSNNNVSDFPKVEQEPADWNQQLESAPPTDTGESWTGTEAETANAVSAEWEDVNQATGETTPSATATKEGGKPAEATPAKVPEPETKSYEDYLKDQEKKRSELQELLEKKEISGFTTRQIVIDKNETGRYVDAHRETDQKPKEEKVKKVKEPKEEKVKKAKIVPLHELGFKMEQQGGYNRRRYNDVRDSQEGGSGEGGENQAGEQQQPQGGENRGRGRGRRGGRGGGAGGGRNARSGRQSNRGAFNNNRGNGGNVLPSQPEDWPALVH
jgi:hypothetical protein